MKNKKLQGTNDLLLSVAEALKQMLDDKEILKSKELDTFIREITLGCSVILMGVHAVSLNAKVAKKK